MAIKFGRRTLFGVTGSLAAGAALTSCGSSRSSKSSGSSAAANNNVKLPTYKARPIVKPDIQGDGSALQYGFYAYPYDNAPRAVQTKPGAGQRCRSLP